MGVEVREELVNSTTALARTIGANGLTFVAGTIENTTLPSVDALIALHACNTGTDDAIRRGIELAAPLILVAPCCHQELRPQLGRPAPFEPVLAHGIMAERMAEWATDGLRSLFLEWAGYRTKMIEFVSTEHTPKNLMIAAVRDGKPFASPTARERSRTVQGFLRNQASRIGFTAHTWTGRELTGKRWSGCAAHFSMAPPGCRITGVANATLRVTIRRSANAFAGSGTTS